MEDLKKTAAPAAPVGDEMTPPENPATAPIELPANNIRDADPSPPVADGAALLAPAASAGSIFSTPRSGVIGNATNRWQGLAAFIVESTRGENPPDDVSKMRGNFSHIAEAPAKPISAPIWLAIAAAAVIGDAAVAQPIDVKTVITKAVAAEVRSCHNYIAAVTNFEMWPVSLSSAGQCRHRRMSSNGLASYWDTKCHYDPHGNGRSGADSAVHVPELSVRCRLHQPTFISGRDKWQRPFAVI